MASILSFTRLRPRESRSGASGKGTKRQVQLRLTEQDAERIDALADSLGLDRSSLVVWLVEMEYVVRPPGVSR